MHGFMLQGSYGKFGLTAAMFRRCNEFAKRGIKCTSLTLDFTNDIYASEKNMKSEKEIDDSVNFRNPYIDLSIKAEEWSRKITCDMEKSYLLCLYSGENSSSESIYFDSSGNSKSNPFNFEFDKVKKTKHEGILIHEEFLSNSNRVFEKYYSITGQCICIKKWNKENGKQECFLTFDYSIGFVFKHSDSFSWNVSWIKDVINEIPENERKEKPFIICDGPGSAAKIIRLDNKEINRIYVLHHNHKHPNGSPTKRDAGNLSSRKKFDAIIALTKEHTKDLEKEYKGFQFTTIPNFTDITAKKTSDGYDHNKIGFFGQLIDRKGLKDAIDVIKKLREEYQLDVYLNVYGASPTDTEAAIKLYHDYAKINKVGDQIIFKGYTQSAAKEMEDCNCIIFPSYSEAQGLSVVEALSVGTPVVAYDCKYGPSSMLKNDYNGYLTAVGDKDKLAEHIADIINSPSLREKMSKNAVISSKEITNKDKIFDLWLELIK